MIDSRSDPAILGLIGNTPLVELTRLDTGRCRLFVKLESQNPGGSIKDRIALSMIAAAEQDGRLRPGGTVVEATAGNTGLGLALVARAKGYRVLLVIPDKMSAEKVLHLKALGAEIRMTRSDVTKGVGYYRDMAGSSPRDDRAFYVNQLGNPPTRWRERRSAADHWGRCSNAWMRRLRRRIGRHADGAEPLFRTREPDTEMVLATRGLGSRGLRRSRRWAQPAHGWSRASADFIPPSPIFRGKGVPCPTGRASPRASCSGAS
jgi:cystathionine beta-synthase